MSEMSVVLRTVPSKLVFTAGYQRCVSTSSINCALDKKWRRSRGLPENPTSFSPLTNLPDYTYMDGRPTPIGLNMSRRLERQRQAAKEMVEKIRELDFAKDRYAKMQREKVENRERIMESKLKPKGPSLLKN